MARRERHAMPPFVARALEEADLVDAYEARPPYQRNDYVGWITRAKRDDTKQRRLAQMLDELRAGDVYMKMAWRPRGAATAKPDGDGPEQPADIDAYLAALEPTKRATLQRLREDILAVVPDAEEAISYGMPAFRVGGKVVAGFAAFAGHCSYLPHSSTVLSTLGDEVAGYATSKGALKFAVDEPLPRLLIEQLIAARLAELES